MATKSNKIARKVAKARQPRKTTTQIQPKQVPPISAAAPTSAKPRKRDQLASLLLRQEGATIDQMMAATGWLPHTVRAALTGLRKLGYAVDSDKVDGLRTYRAVAPK